MKNRTSNPKQGQEWFERKVAELKTQLEKLPADRQEQLNRELAVDGEPKKGGA